MKYVDAPSASTMELSCSRMTASKLPLSSSSLYVVLSTAITSVAMPMSISWDCRILAAISNVVPLWQSISNARPSYEDAAKYSRARSGS